MNLTNDAGVLPPKFDDDRINRAIGTIIGKFSDDDVQALAFRQAELQAAIRIRGAWLDLCRTIANSAVPTAERIEFISTGEGWSSVSDEALEFHRADQLQLEKEGVLARMYVVLANKVVAALADSFGVPGITNSYRRGAQRDQSPLAYLGFSADAYDRARRRLEASSAVWESALDSFVAEARKRNAYAKTTDSISMSIIDSYRGDILEHGVALLLERDGCTILRRHGGKNDQGADVIALTPTGLRIVVQCKHSTNPSSRIGPRSLFELNGTARPVHNADVVAIVTNRALTSAAERFATTQGIHVVDRRRLERWATYGVPWYPSAGRSTLPIWRAREGLLAVS